ncbi:hypothetical protein GE061_019729 [Apolygus lucorum]|uniref:Uncharacterized protein n=1 Tax=Apolygus lucorum TaxID=248454 RepID=A0A8S9XBW8_APOLU|nr:hypothetical protein GE061_019729 [Apolygus lucorum]
MDRLTTRINDLARKLRGELDLSKALLADNASSPRDLEDALARLQRGLSFFKETDDQLTNRQAGSSRRRQTPDPDEAQSAATIVDTRWEAEQTLALLSMRIKKLDRTAYQSVWLQQEQDQQKSSTQQNALSCLTERTGEQLQASRSLALAWA